MRVPPMFLLVSLLACYSAGLLAGCAASTRQPADLDPAEEKCPKCVEAMTREERGFRDDSYTLEIDALRARFRKPAPDHDYKIDSYQLLSAVSTIVARDRELRSPDRGPPGVRNKHGQLVRGEIVASLHRQLKRIFWKRLELEEREGEAMSQNVVREALGLMGLGVDQLARLAGVAPMKDSEITALVKSASEKLWRSSTIDAAHDVPYIAGYAADDPKYIFIDRLVPREGKLKGKRSEGGATGNGSEGGATGNGSEGGATTRTVRAHYLLNVHERVEKILLDDLGLTYQHAHQIAQRTERRAAKGDGVGWEEYDRWMEPISDKLGTARPLRIHPRLDMTCYYSYDDDDNLGLVAAMEEAKRSAR